jgi:outer membrane receptor protein involved in Fe transport
MSRLTAPGDDVSVCPDPTSARDCPMIRPQTLRAALAAPALAILAVAVTLPSAGHGQGGSATLRGRVVSAADSTPLGDVIVYAPAPGAETRVARAGVTTGASGLFELRLPAGAARVVAMRLGFAPETLAVDPVRDRAGRLTIRMRPVALALSPTIVRAEPALSAASSSVIRQLDIRIRPRESSQELLRLAPGLVIAQHAGGGKAEQIFLRGFDADHGTDVAVTVDGSPVNMPTHAHGQGYADLHFVMPEVVEHAEVRKGPYDARDGDFATAGAVAFRTRDRVDAPSLEVRRGSFGTDHAIALLPIGGDASRAGGYIAASAHRSDGPFEAPQGYRRLNAFAKWTAPVSSGTELVAAASAFDARWDASGQVPDRAVRAGAIGRFGAIDATEGGTTSRYDASLALRPRAAGASAWEARAWATRYRFDLFSNFTFFLADSVSGDGIEQVDDRVALGAHAWYGRAATVLGRAATWSAGAGARGDAGDVALHGQRARDRLAPRVMVDVRQAHLYQWARAEAQLAPRLRLALGLRADLFRFGVADRLPDDAPAAPARPDGVRWRGIVSPKGSLALDVAQRTTLFANAGAGFHSNDARDAVLARRGDRVLPRAVGAEVGARHSWSGGSIGAAAWMLDLESELVYVGDEGVTEASGRTRRVGVDVELRARLAPWLWADADVNLARGRFRDEPRGADRIPLAPRLTTTAGLTVRDLAAPALRGLDGGVRVRHVGPRPADETGDVRALGATVWELFAGWRVSRARLFVAVDNLFDAAWNEAQFATTSRLLGEPAPVTALHYTPGAPRSVQAGVEWRFSRE